MSVPDREAALALAKAMDIEGIHPNLKLLIDTVLGLEDAIIIRPSDGIPEELVERAAAVIASFDGYDAIDGQNGVAPWLTYQDDARKVLEAVFGEKEER